MPQENMNNSAVDEQDDTPDLARASEIPFNYAMRIETDILTPVVNVGNMCRFTLQRKGFLSHQSKIQLSLLPDPANDGMYFYPVQIGVNSIIRRAVLKCGNRTLCETDEWNRLQGYRSMFLTNENNREREYYLTQRLMSYQPQYSVGQTISIVSTTIGLDTGRNISTAANQLLPFSIMNSTDANRVAESPLYSVYLGDLFDIFNKGNNLPLYLITDDIHIELYYEDAMNRRVCSDAGADADAEYEIDTNAVKLIYDTIYYDGETMEKYRRGKGSKLEMGYVDYRLTRRTGDDTLFGNGITQSLGGAGRMVDKVIVAFSDLELDGLNDGENLLTNRYFSQSPNLSTRKISMNVRYNDRDEYTRDLENLSTLFCETSKAEQNAPPNVPKALYSAFQNDSISTNTLQGRNQHDDLIQAFCYQSFKLKRGERINNQGIDLVYTNTITGLDDHTLFVWIGLKKICTIKDGYMDSYFV